MQQFLTFYCSMYRTKKNIIMKAKTVFLLIVALVLGLGLTFTSCKKSYTPDQATGNDNTQADNAVADAIFFGLEHGGGQKALLGDDSTCFDIDIDTLEINNGLKIQVTLTFDNCDPFGNGVIRNGQIIITRDLGWLFNPKKALEIRFRNFSRDSIGIQGHITMQFDHNIAEGQPVYNITEDSMQLSFPDNTTFSWSGNRTIQWISGFNTPKIRRDNSIKVSYHRTGTNRKGENFEATANNLLFDASCKYRMPLSGTLQITKDNGESFTLDFGDGKCDGCMIYSSNGNQVQICHN